MHKKNPQPHNLNRHNGLILWEKWVLATAVGELVGLSILTLASVVSHSVIGNVNTHIILLLVGTLQGAILGFSQWLVLSHSVYLWRLWVQAYRIPMDSASRQL